MVTCFKGPVAKTSARGCSLLPWQQIPPSYLTTAACAFACTLSSPPSGFCQCFDSVFYPLWPAPSPPAPAALWAVGHNCPNDWTRHRSRDSSAVRMRSPTVITKLWSCDTSPWPELGSILNIRIEQSCRVRTPWWWWWWWWLSRSGGEKARYPVQPGSPKVSVSLIGFSLSFWHSRADRSELWPDTHSVLFTVCYSCSSISGRR